ncbi:MAG: AAA family ATPase [Ignavibacteria bacterium]|jgi:DNA transposition AAA+ family ATPase|nr:AAA family ATPase [Ignavibacteria bacterium]MCU7503825.1 AAA family ATPase [Ignavibacteria bacterium]MCU7517161.1 AAA family ATPase [Ignavibacteria bacterium]
MDLKDELKLYMKEHEELSQSEIARSIGVSSTTISQWINNIYAGNVAKIDDKVKTFLELQKERLSSPKGEVQFINTSNVKKGFETAKICHLDGEIGVLYGEAGCGKTTLLKEYARHYNNVILIEADLGFTTKILFRKLHRELGMDGLGCIHDMFEDVTARLKNSGRLIIIDEAEHLPYRALELLRRVYDKAHVGVLLAGMPRLISNLRGKKGEYAQLYSRVGIATRLDSLKHQDTEAIVKSVLPSSNGIWKEFHEYSGGNTRILCKMLLRSRRLAQINECDVTKEIVKKTAEMLII